MSTRQGAVSAPGGFVHLPSTLLGSISVVVFLAGIALGVLTSTALQSVSDSVGSLNIIGAANLLVFLAALVPGAIALIRDGERSWAVWLSTGLPALVIGFELLTLLIPGE